MRVETWCLGFVRANGEGRLYMSLIEQVDEIPTTAGIVGIDVQTTCNDEMLLLSTGRSTTLKMRLQQQAHSSLDLHSPKLLDDKRQRTEVPS